MGPTLGPASSSWWGGQTGQAGPVSYVLSGAVASWGWGDLEVGLSCHFQQTGVPGVNPLETVSFVG